MKNNKDEILEWLKYFYEESYTDISSSKFYDYLEESKKEEEYNNLSESEKEKMQTKWKDEHQEEIYDEVLKEYYQDNYAGPLDTEEAYIDFFNFFYEKSKKQIEKANKQFTKEGCKKIIDNLNTDFFKSNINILYLKLLNLYDESTNTTGERNTELKYIIDEYEPLIIEEKNILKELNSAVSKENQPEYKENFVSNMYNYTKLFEPYKLALKEIKEKLKKDKNNKMYHYMAYAIETFIEAYEYSAYNFYHEATEKAYNEQTADEKERNKELSDVDMNMLAKMYCKAYGGNLTPKEILVIRYTHNKEEMATLVDATKKTSRR